MIIILAYGQHFSGKQYKYLHASQKRNSTHLKEALKKTGKLIYTTPTHKATEYSLVDNHDNKIANSPSKTVFLVKICPCVEQKIKAVQIPVEII